MSLACDIPFKEIEVLRIGVLQIGAARQKRHASIRTVRRLAGHRTNRSALAISVFGVSVLELDRQGNLRAGLHGDLTSDPLAKMGGVFRRCFMPSRCWHNRAHGGESTLKIIVRIWRSLRLKPAGRAPVSDLARARALIDAIDRGGVVSDALRVNAIARSLGLEVSRRAPVEQTVQRIRAAVQRADSNPLP